MIKQFALCIITATLMTAHAGQAGSPSSAAITQYAAAPAPEFGSMGTLVGGKFIWGSVVSEVRLDGDGATLNIGTYQLRRTNGSQFEVTGRRGWAASLGPDGALNLTGEDDDSMLRINIKPNASGGYTESVDFKSLAGLNFLQKWRFGWERNYLPYTDANVRLEAANKQFREQLAGQIAAESRAVQREADRGFTNAVNAGLGTLKSTLSQQAQADARQDGMLANLNAQAVAQREAQAAQAQRQAEQQRQELARNANWAAEKQQTASQYEQAVAAAQTQRAIEAAAQRRIEHQQEEQRRIAQAQARQEARQEVVRNTEQIEKQRQQEAQQPRRLTVAGDTSSAPEPPSDSWKFSVPFLSTPRMPM